MSRRFLIGSLSLSVAFLLVVPNSLAAEGKDQFEQRQQINLKLADNHDDPVRPSDHGDHRVPPAHDYDDHWRMSNFDFRHHHEHCDKHGDWKHCPVSPN